RGEPVYPARSNARAGARTQRAAASAAHAGRRAAVRAALARSCARCRALLSRLRFGLLCDGRSLESWHLRCLEELEPYAHLAGTIVAPPVRETGSRLARAYARRLRVRRAVDVTGRFQQLRGDETLDFVLRLGRVAPDAAREFDTLYGVWCFEHEDDGP